MHHGGHKPSGHNEITMIIGIPKEIKKNEYRISVTPAGAQALVETGHKVLIEQNAGNGSSFSDEEYSNVGATILKSRDELFETSDLIVKVKEPITEEFALRRAGIFTFKKRGNCVKFSGYEIFGPSQQAVIEWLSEKPPFCEVVERSYNRVILSTSR